MQTSTETDHEQAEEAEQATDAFRVPWGLNSQPGYFRNLLAHQAYIEYTMYMSPEVPAPPREGLDAAAAAGQALYRLAAVMVERLASEVSLTAVSMLGVIDLVGPLRVTELAAMQQVTQPSMTALVNRLESSGLVERHQDPHDQRAVLVSLSQRGVDYLQSFGREGAEKFARLIAALPSDEAAALTVATKALEHLWELAHEELAARADQVPSRAGKGPVRAR